VWLILMIVLLIVLRHIVITMEKLTIMGTLFLLSMDVTNVLALMVW